MTVWELTFEALKVLAQIGGWILSLIIGFFWYEQRNEIKRLKELSAILRKHDTERREKDKIRDKILRDLSAIVSDEKMTKENREKIEELFKDLDKPWMDEIDK